MTATAFVPSLRQALASAEAAGEHEIAAGIRHLRAMGRFARGDGAGFAAEVDGLATAAAASRTPEALCLADSLGAMRAVVEGRFVEARALADRAIATGRRTQVANAAGQFVSQRIVDHLVRGRLGEIADEIERFVSEHPSGQGWEPFRVLSHLAAGDAVRARDGYRTLLAAGLDRAEKGVLSRTYLAGLALLCVALEDRESATPLHGAIARCPEVWLADGCHTFGPRALTLGALALLCERTGEAVAHLEEALEAARRMRARPYVAAAQALLAEALLALDGRARHGERVGALLDEAERTAEQLDLAHVTARVKRLRANHALAEVAPISAFRWEGDFWTVSFAGRDVRVRDGKGPRYLVSLLAAPGRDFHVLEMAGGSCGAQRLATVADGLSVGSLGAALEDAPDPQAARAYRAHLAELRAELDEAEESCDPGRAEKLRVEHDFLVSQLAQRFGSRVRTHGPAETARKAVTKVLRTQIARLLESHPALGRHLSDAVRTGLSCSYVPATPTAWEITRPSDAATPRRDERRDERREERRDDRCERSAAA